MASLLEGDLKTTLETNLTDPSIVKTEMKNKISVVWNSFISNAENALRFEIIADTIAPNLLTDIKAFQKTISEKAQGLIEASKLMNVGDTVKISENMTEVRSALSKLKQHMKVKYEEIKEITQKLATLEKACYATDSQEEKGRIIDEVETIANSLKWEQTWDQFSYA
ncbi:MAG: hypothetical protein GY810_17710 [Aureispira sp.]|nr:hypothetical protein [Aureispira sp.]